MARIMNYDQTDIYRMVVTYRYANGNKNYQDIYGPHDTSNQARDHEIRTRGPHRLEKQKLAPVHTEESDGTQSLDLQWFTIRTEYRNGGEKVEWDD